MQNNVKKSYGQVLPNNKDDIAINMNEGRLSLIDSPGRFYRENIRARETCRQAMIDAQDGPSKLKDAIMARNSFPDLNTEQCYKIFSLCSEYLSKRNTNVFHDSIDNATEIDKKQFIESQIIGNTIMNVLSQYGTFNITQLARFGRQFGTPAVNDVFNNFATDSIELQKKFTDQLTSVHNHNKTEFNGATHVALSLAAIFATAITTAGVLYQGAVEQHLRCASTAGASMGSLLLTLGSLAYLGFLCKKMPSYIETAQMLQTEEILSTTTLPDSMYPSINTHQTLANVSNLKSSNNVGKGIGISFLTAGVLLTLVSSYFAKVECIDLKAI